MRRKGNNGTCKKKDEKSKPTISINKESQSKVRAFHSARPQYVCTYIYICVWCFIFSSVWIFNANVNVERERERDTQKVNTNTLYRKDTAYNTRCVMCIVYRWWCTELLHKKTITTTTTKNVMREVKQNKKTEYWWWCVFAFDLRLKEWMYSFFYYSYVHIYAYTQQHM